MLARQRITFNFFIEIRSRHLHRACGLRDVPVELAQLVEEKRALRRVLELLEGAALCEARESGVVERALTREPIDVPRRDL